MKEKIRDFRAGLEHKAAGVLYRLCGGLSPIKRFVIVLILGGVFLSAYVYVLVNSIYNLGKRNAEIEFLNLQNSESQKLEQESINILKFENYEYE